MLATRVRIGIVIGAVTNSLKSPGKNMVKGRQQTGKKHAAFLFPSLIGSIVSFIFKTGGQAISFLEKHTGLMILALVTFLMDWFHKFSR